MFKGLTYKQKFFAIIFVIILLFFACYKKSFKHTLKAKNELALLESKLEGMENVYQEINYLDSQIEVIENTIGSGSDKPELVQKQLLNFISKNAINIVSIEDVHVYKDSQYDIYTNQIVLQGEYSDLLNTMYSIEKQFKESRIASANLYAKRDYKLNSDKLYLKLILQNYAKNK